MDFAHRSRGFGGQRDGRQVDLIDRVGAADRFQTDLDSSAIACEHDFLVLLHECAGFCRRDPRTESVEENNHVRVSSRDEIGSSIRVEVAYGDRHWTDAWRWNPQCGW